MASRKAPPRTATSAAHAIIRCLCSTSSAIWSDVRCAPAMSTAPMAGAMCLNRLWRVIAGARSSGGTSGVMPPSRCPVSMTSLRPRVTIRHPPQGQRDASAPDRPSAQTPCRSATQPCSAALCQLPLSGRVMEPETAGGRQGRVAPGRALSARQVYRHQSRARCRPGRGVLQPARRGGTVHQGGQERGQMDPAVVPHHAGQRGAAPASCACLQPCQLPAHPRPAAGGTALVADQHPRQAREDRREAGQAMPATPSSRWPR